MIREEIGQRSETKNPTRALRAEQIQLRPFYGDTEFQGVSSMCEKGIVVRLERIPVVEISRLSAQTSLKIRKSRYHYLRRASPRHTAQRWVRRQRINRFDSLIV